MHHLRHEIGGGGRDHDEIGLTREADVPDVELGGKIEKFGEGPLARDCADRKRGHEFLRRTGHDHAHFGAALTQSADQVQALIGRDPDGDDE